MLMSNPFLPCFLLLSLVIEEKLKDHDDLVNRADDGPVPTLGLDNDTSKPIENGWYRGTFEHAHTPQIAFRQCLFSHLVLAPDSAQT